MGRIPWLGFLPNASPARRRPQSATRRSPSPALSLGERFPRRNSRIEPLNRRNWSAGLRPGAFQNARHRAGSETGAPVHGQGGTTHRLSSKPVAGLMKVAFEGHGGDKTCSFSPREKVRMRGKQARYFQVASGPSSRNHPALPITNIEEPFG